MSTFHWIIYDAPEDSAPDQKGGEVELRHLRVTGGTTWEVEAPDLKITIQPIHGGTVEPFSSPGGTEKVLAQKALRVSLLRADSRLFRVVVITVLILLGLGFLVVVVKDVQQNKLDFQTYTMFLSTFLAGIGAGKLGRGGGTEQGDGSG
jgi:hypothetical protein